MKPMPAHLVAFLFANGALAAGQPAPSAKPAPDDEAFCKEVLILHHSHVDVGYTHPQSLYWELPS